MIKLNPMSTTKKNTFYQKQTGEQLFTLGDILYGWTPPNFFNYYTK